MMRLRRLPFRSKDECADSCIGLMAGRAAALPAFYVCRAAQRILPPVSKAGKSSLPLKRRLSGQMTVNTEVERTVIEGRCHNVEEQTYPFKTGSYVVK